MRNEQQWREGGRSGGHSRVRKTSREAVVVIQVGKDEDLN